MTETCNSCKHTAAAAEFVPELTPSWVPTGKKVCRDPDACFKRWLARTPAPPRSNGRSR